MKKSWVWAALAGLAALIVLLGCEWTSNTDSFNTARGAGATVNFSGVYKGALAGGKAVANTTGGTINRLVISQAGNTVQVLDNNGSRYTGHIGSPGVVAAAGMAGAYPAGAQLVQAQISFSGHDNVAAKKVTFVGVIHGVAVDDVRGFTTTETTTDTTSQGYLNYTTNITTSFTGGTNITTTITIRGYDAMGNEVFRQVQTYTITPSGQTIVNTVVLKDERSRVRTEETVEVTKYYITEANTQYRLQGTWIEEGGAIAEVDALSPASAGVITAVTPSGAPGTTTQTTTTQ